MSRRWWSRTIATALTAVALMASAAPGRSATKKLPPLLLSAQGSFFVGGHPEHTDYPSSVVVTLPGLPPITDPGRIISDQAYVSYQIPARRSHLRDGRPIPPLVLIHGCCLSGKTWETTPDGREGWSTRFIRYGAPVYVLDQVGRGRSGFNPEPFNRMRLSKDGGTLPPILGATMEFSWPGFRFGPRYGESYPGARFPVEYADQLFAQMVPDFTPSLRNPAATPDAIVALLQRIGPAVLVVHSQSGPMAWRVAYSHPELVAGIVNLEGNCPAAPDPVPTTLTKVPAITLFGDYLSSSVSSTAVANDCARLTERLKAQGMNARQIMLADVGMPGHTHMMMQDYGSEAIAAYVLAWVKANVR